MKNKLLLFCALIFNVLQAMDDTSSRECLLVSKVKFLQQQDSLSIKQLEKVDLKPFKKIVELGVGSVSVEKYLREHAAADSTITHINMAQVLPPETDDDFPVVTHLSKHEDQLKNADLAIISDGFQWLRDDEKKEVLNRLVKHVDRRGEIQLIMPVNHSAGGTLLYNFSRAVQQKQFQEKVKKYSPKVPYPLNAKEIVERFKLAGLDLRSMSIREEKYSFATKEAFASWMKTWANKLPDAPVEDGELEDFVKKQVKKYCRNTKQSINKPIEYKFPTMHVIAQILQSQIIFKPGIISPYVSARIQN